jgi:predicted TIM-barrel fold metal-dependent hydrolase
MTAPVATTKPGLVPGDIRNDYFIVSADCHVAEPPNLWQERIDEQFRHRLPRIEIDANGEKWSVREGHRPVRIRQLQLEGEDLERSKAGSRDPDLRWADHRRDGIDAEVVYPNAGLMMWASEDPAMQAQMTRVWTDWVMETFQDRLDRVAPAAAVAPLDIENVAAEVHRIGRMGFRHVMLPVQPGKSNDGRPLGYNLPMFDALWQALVDENLAISFHVGTGKDPRTASGNGGAIINYVVHALSPAIEPVTQLCASGVLERLPDLRFVTVEAGIGWLAWTLWVMDEGAKKHHMWAEPKLPMLPSEYWRRQGYATFQDDPVGLATAGHFGLDRIMWGNDYPHHEGTWPHSDEAIVRTMGHLGHDQRRAILGETAAKVYGFNVS